MHEIEAPPSFPKELKLKKFFFLNPNPAGSV